MVKQVLKSTLLLALVTATAAGCTNPRHEGTGTNDNVYPRNQSSNYRPFHYGTGSNRDLRLGLDRYRGNDPDLIRDSDSLRQGLNRDNGFSGYDNDGVNRWSDYHGYGRTNNNTRLETNYQIAEQLTTIDPVQSAIVLLSDDNAYVAVTLKNGGDVDSAGSVKQQIADKVQSIRPELRNVYVSSNPDFVQWMKGYAQQLSEGKPFQGFINEFNIMVQRIFPQNAAQPGTQTGAPGTNATQSGTSAQDGTMTR